jgi:hypothetical protein
MRFVELGRYLCEVRAGQYWWAEDLKPFDEFLERRILESRRKGDYLMSIHEHLPPQARKELKESAVQKDCSWRRLPGGTGSTSIVQPWLHKTHEMPKQEF